MNQVRTRIPFEFVLLRIGPGWADLRYGLEHLWLDPLAPIYAAQHVLTTRECCDDRVSELVWAESVNRVVTLVDELVAREPAVADEELHRKWLFLVLAWLYEHRTEAEDPFAMVEMVHADFGYPTEIESFVSYVPMQGPDLGSRSYGAWNDPDGFVGDRGVESAPARIRRGRSRHRTVRCWTTCASTWPSVEGTRGARHWGASGQASGRRLSSSWIASSFLQRATDAAPVREAPPMRPPGVPMLMLTRTALIAAIAIAAFTPAASSQSVPVPVSGPIRDAGIYHVETDTWTRRGSIATLGADVVYNNTCPSGYFFPLGDDTLVDEGRLPSPSGPTNIAARPGCAVAYTIDGVELAYCSDGGPGTTYTIDFYQSYAPCSSVIGVAPTGTIALNSLPQGITGTLACWILTIDLGQDAFTMLADGNGAYTGNETQNLFGWSMRTNATTSNVGPLIAGNPNLSLRYDGTRWDNGPGVPFWPNNLGEDGTGMGSLDLYRLEGGASMPGCYWGSGSVFRSFHLAMFSDACSPPTGMSFCAGDGSGTACPCGNNSVPGRGEGCLNTLGVGAKISVAGEASLSADTIVLLGSQMPPGSFALFFQGHYQQNSGAGSVFGDGLRCAGGTVGRMRVTSIDASGNTYYPSSGSQPSVSVQGFVPGPGVRTYQAWYRNVAPFCTPLGYNLSNGWTLTWGA